jgi:hypothetical protein
VDHQADLTFEGDDWLLLEVEIALLVWSIQLFAPLFGVILDLLEGIL